jgi:hypothetical protein
MRFSNSLVPPAGFDPMYPKNAYSVDGKQGIKLVKSLHKIEKVLQENLYIKTPCNLHVT